ncbi:hypothetical protein SPRG_15000 [Saprolegnia parasitica CBS 223.65]|uniref:subtilisin n=1 Tax=Saprolegnia parasitica (strain CBS 223.65) TaxID=695850 RepID=A0A067BXK1_SAPPC|nr:hypothetical protein SPRG_15000 [Saprolegnia parasitica CBS 223.65]KDO19046.1 hypothetical protein SPRG_15000 [Saprolegnia parasitica CBS 223.65]|eukprot:XP_012210234.1 hypothetical protein SPRG_15000 [Saprolegnia parasitica CBS 223.65]
MKLAVIVSALVASTAAKITSSALRQLEADNTFQAFVTFAKDASKLESLELAGATAEERRESVYQSSSAVAAKRQALLEQVLGTGHKIRSLWISEVTIIDNVDKALAAKIAAIEGVIKVDAVKEISLSPVVTKADDSANVNARPTGIQWGVTTIGAPDIWKHTRGAGVVVGSIDTGARHTHEAIKSKWRADRGWFDPYNTSAVPEDLNGHGTHTIGTMVGDYGLGVAPDAQWIACRGLYNRVGTNAALLECAQFMICPTETDGNKPDCKKGANVINNSWGGATTTDPWFQDMIDAWHKAGITPIFANGNDGPACATAGNPANYPNLIAVGAIGSHSNEPTKLAYFSSKGPAKYVDNMGQSHPIIKPDISAPGFFTYSSYMGSDTDYQFSAGTSMAAPHVAGVVALMKSVQKDLTYDEIYHALTTTTDQSMMEVEPSVWRLPKNKTLPAAPNCGGVSDASWPNNRYGYGRVNVAKILKDGKLPVPPPAPTSAPVQAADTISLCNYKHNVLSEWNGQLFVDTEKKNLNEKFWYNFDDKSIQSQSNNETCLDVYQDVQGKNQVRLHPCTGGSAQKWGFEPNSHSIRHLTVRNLCLESARATPGAAPFVAECTGGVSQWFTKCEEAPAARSYVKLITKNKKAISEFYSGVYANWASDTTNELFTYDTRIKTLQAASNGECLDAFRDGDKFGLHTYACDATNANQKWIIDAAGHKIKHATHNNVCLDVDPTNPTHAAQVWECHDANTNQWIDAIAF